MTKLIYVSKVNNRYVAYTPGSITLYGKTIRNAVASVMFIEQNDDYKFLRIHDSETVFEFECVCKFIKTHLTKHKSYELYDALNFYKREG